VARLQTLFAFNRYDVGLGQPLAFEESVGTVRVLPRDNHARIARPVLGILQLLRSYSRHLLVNSEEDLACLRYENVNNLERKLALCERRLSGINCETLIFVVIMILANDSVSIEIHVVLKWNTKDTIVLIA